MFTREQRTALLLLLPLALLAAVGVALLRPRRTAVPNAAPNAVSDAAESHPADSLFAFDPNTVTYRELRRLGFARRDAAGILRYRAAGKVFRIPEDFAACYQVSDSMYDRLEAYVVIGEAYRFHPRRDTAVRPRRVFERTPFGRAARPVDSLRPFRIDTASERFWYSIGFTRRQAAAIADHNALIGGFRNADELADYPVIGDSAARRIARYALFPERRRPADEPLELNRADSAALRSVHGIGEGTVGAILDYRRRLGGFVRAEQLAEVKGVTESNYEKIIRQIRVDSCEISKIDINFAPPEAMLVHPYLPPRIVRKIVKHRQLKGGWSTVEEMLEEEILTREEAERLRPYLRFTRRAKTVR